MRRSTQTYFLVVLLPLNSDEMIEHRFDHISDNSARRQAWIDSVSDVYEAKIDHDTVISHRIFQKYYNLNQIIFSESNLSAQKATRTQSHIAAQNIDHIALLLHLFGRSRIMVNGQSHDVTRMSLITFDMGQPGSVEIDGGIDLCLTVPQRLLEACGGDASSWHGRIVPADSAPLFQLLTDHLRNIAACLGMATPLQKERVATATLALCNAALLPATDSAHDRAAVATIAMRQFIDKHLATVDAEMLMAQFGLSRTPLYKLFEAEGGVYAYIRSRRLVYAMQQLVRLGERRPTIKQLTFACGFENEQVFSRAFRRKYGLNPSEVDSHSLPCANWDRASHLMAWLKDL